MHSPRLLAWSEGWKTLGTLRSSAELVQWLCHNTSTTHSVLSISVISAAIISLLFFAIDLIIFHCRVNCTHDSATKQDILRPRLSSDVFSMVFFGDPLPPWPCSDRFRVLQCTWKYKYSVTFCSCAGYKFSILLKEKGHYETATDQQQQTMGSLKVLQPQVQDPVPSNSLNVAATPVPSTAPDRETNPNHSATAVHSVTGHYKVTCIPISS